MEYQTEKDPNGKDAHESGAKLDHGKNRIGLVVGGFSMALQAVSEVGTYGANKYTDNGWKEVPMGVQRYTDAMYRHLFAEAAGEERDPDTDLLHAAHAAWNALARLNFIMLRGNHGTQELDPRITAYTGDDVNNCRLFGAESLQHNAIITPGKRESAELGAATRAAADWLTKKPAE